MKHQGRFNFLDTNEDEIKNLYNNMDNCLGNWVLTKSSFIIEFQMLQFVKFTNGVPI